MSDLSMIGEELNYLFGFDTSSELIKSGKILELLRRAWQGKLCSASLRGISWRVLLDLISDNTSQWPSQFKAMVKNYAALKDRRMPSIDKVSVDPLSALSADNGSMSEEWKTYYKQLDLMKFIEGDLDRLYLTGLEDEYFQNKPKRDLLLGILVVWSIEHSTTSYRQGMHEVLGVIVHVLDIEEAAWKNSIKNGEFPADHPLGLCFQPQYIEAYAYYIFDRIMLEMEPLYDPLPVSGHENIPFVVAYCTKIQEHYLGILDPPLCTHLEGLYIQSQLYGLRWSRLLLGREYSVTHKQLLALWDFMFASCYDAEHSSNSALLDDDVPPNVYSVLANVRVLQHHKDSNKNKREIAEATKKQQQVKLQQQQQQQQQAAAAAAATTVTVNGGLNNTLATSGGSSKNNSSSSSNSKSITPTAAAAAGNGGGSKKGPVKDEYVGVMYVCTPLLGILADFMLAMLIQVRTELLEGDQSVAMSLLMHYPEQTSILPVLECCDMIRRGVIIRSIGYSGAVFNYDPNAMSPEKQSTHPPAAVNSFSVSNTNTNNTTQSSNKQSVFPVTKRVTDRISNIKAGINEFVQTKIVAPLLDLNDYDMSSSSTNNSNSNTATSTAQMQSNPTHGSTINAFFAQQQDDLLVPTTENPMKSNTHHSHSGHSNSNTGKVVSSNTMTRRSSKTAIISGLDPLTAPVSHEEYVAPAGTGPTNHHSSHSSHHNNHSSSNSARKGPLTTHTTSTTTGTATKKAETFADPLHTTTSVNSLPLTNLSNKHSTTSSTSSTTGEGSKSKSSSSSSSTSSSSSGSSLFSPGWFPSSSSKSAKKEYITTTSSSTAGGGITQVYRSDRSSVGVDLNVLNAALHPATTSTTATSTHTNDVGSGMLVNTTSSTTNTNTGIEYGGSSQYRQNNAIGDRLLDIADQVEEYTRYITNTNNTNTNTSSTATTTSASAATAANGTGSVAVDSKITGDVNKVIASRLRHLADILAGVTTIVEYDMKFGNRTIVADAADAAAAVIASTVAATSNATATTGIGGNEETLLSLTVPTSFPGSKHSTMTGAVKVVDEPMTPMTPMTSSSSVMQQQQQDEEDLLLLNTGILYSPSNVVTATFHQLTSGMGTTKAVKEAELISLEDESTQEDNLIPQTPNSGSMVMVDSPMFRPENV